MILEKASYFLLGIKGTAMANIAVMLKQMGCNVSGVDVAEEFITDATLLDNAILYSTNFSDTNILDGYDVFVYSAAHGGLNNPLGLSARKRGMKIMSQPELVGEMFSLHEKSIAVAGCHGKTTTSSLMAYALSKLGRNPSYLIGAPPFEGSGGGKMTDSPYMVVEADEYGVHPPADKTPKLLFLHPKTILCMNIDFDHPDVYDDLEMTKKTFVKFLSQSKRCVVCMDDSVIRSILPLLDKSSLVSYGMDERSTYRLVNGHTTEKGLRFGLTKNAVILGTFETGLFGEKNMLNAAGVVATLFELGFKAEEIAKSLDGFSGAKRRMETVWTDGNSYLIDDYGHHPAEISATIHALRSRFPGKRLHVLFQPHTYSRTQGLKNDFVTELSKADTVSLLPIFASARENAGDFRITSEALSEIAQNNGKKDFLAFADRASLIAHLKDSWKRGNVVLTLGAGDIYKLKDDIIDILNEKSTGRITGARQD